MLKTIADNNVSTYVSFASMTCYAPVGRDKLPRDYLGFCCYFCSYGEKAYKNEPFFFNISTCLISDYTIYLDYNSGYTKWLKFQRRSDLTCHPSQQNSLCTSVRIIISKSLMFNFFWNEFNILIDLGSWYMYLPVFLVLKSSVEIHSDFFFFCRITFNLLFGQSKRSCDIITCDCLCVWMGNQYYQPSRARSLSHHRARTT